jgi:hypothetical protein
MQLLPLLEVPRSSELIPSGKQVLYELNDSRMKTRKNRVRPRLRCGGVSKAIVSEVKQIFILGIGGIDLATVSR